MTQTNDALDWAGGRPRLTHMGINVIDLEKMVTFYTRLLGLTVSDRGFSERLQCNMAFLTSDPTEHHQVVMLECRAPGSDGNVNQISFKIDTLDQLKDAHRKLAAEGVEAGPIDHGNAWSIYFPDPEGNAIEIYLNSPFYIAQPHGEKLDLSVDNDEILRRTRERIEGQDGFKTREEWAAGLTKKLEGAD